MQGAQALPWAERRLVRSDGFMLSAVVLLCCVVYLLSPVTTSTDSAWTFHVAASILREHNINLDEYRPLMNLQAEYRVRDVRGHIYSYYPVATPLLATPVVWLVNKVYPVIYPTDFYTYLEQHAPGSRTARLEKLVASVIAALAAGLMYLIARSRASTLASLSLAFVFAFSTSMWSTASRALWQHGPSALALALSLYLLVRGGDRARTAFWIGVVLGFSYLIRPTNSLAVAAIGLYLLVNSRRRAAGYAGGLAVVLVPYVLQNWLTYGNPLPPYSYQLFERLASPAVFAEGLAGTIISPGRGLLVFSPLFLFSIYGAYLRLRKRLSPANLDVYLAAVVIAHWIITSLFEDWGGAWSIGPRYFVDMIPYLTYFLIPLFEGRALALPAIKVGLIAAVLFSTLIQLHCSTSIFPFMWNGKPRALVEAPERKWDWGDLQFLRGLCPNDPLEGRAPACWFERNG